MSPMLLARRLRATLALVLLLSPALSIAATIDHPVTLVETRPVETTLGNSALPEALDVWLEQIGGATTSLDLEQFYCSDWPNEPLRPVLDAIGAAAKRGVRVRLLLDKGMHRTYPMPADSLAKLPGIEVRLVDFRRIAGGIQHAKFFLVDGRSLFLGSQNLDWRALKHIHELGVLVSDPRVVAAFQPVFEMDWAAGTKAASDSVSLDSLETLRRRAAEAPVPALPIVIVQAPGDTVRLWPEYDPRSYIPSAARWDQEALVNLLDSARHDIVAQTLTYSPEVRGQRDAALDDALRRAAARGVHVRLLVSDWLTDSREMPQLQALLGVENLEVKLGTVPPWSGGYIPFARVEHCKYAVVDGARVWVGTGNWEPDYFHSSRNLAVTLDNRRLAQQAQLIFETSWKAPGAAALRPGAYPRKLRGLQPPPGQKVYGN